MDYQPTPVTRLPYSSGPLAEAARLPHRTAGSYAPVEPEPSFRVGELERAAACDALAEHYAAGRLDPAELDDRLARAVAARSQADLQVLFRDLQPRRRVPDPAVGPPAAEGPGARTAVPFLAAMLILSLMLAGGMLAMLGAYSSALVVAALVGGTATAVAGGCVVGIGQATLRRR